MLQISLRDVRGQFISLRITDPNGVTRDVLLRPGQTVVLNSTYWRI